MSQKICIEKHPAGIITIRLRDVGAGITENICDDMQVWRDAGSGKICGIVLLGCMDVVASPLQDQLDTLRGENTRLRKGLEGVAALECRNDGGEPWPTSPEEAFEAARDIADYALDPIGYEARKAGR